MGETAHRSNVLLGQVSVSSGVVLGASPLALADSVDLLVCLGSVVVAQLTSSGHAPGDSGRMPSTDTADLSVTSVGFFLEMTDAPSFHDAGESLALGDTDNVEKFVLLEDRVDSDFLFEEGVGEGDLLGGGLSSVDLDFEDVVLLLSEVAHEVVLSVDDSSDNGTVFFNSVELHLHLLGVLGLGLVSAEGFLLGVDPVLVESSESALVEVVGPNSGESSEAAGGFDVSDESDNLQGRSFDDSDGFYFFLFVEFGFGSVDVSEDVGHSCLESTEGCEVRSLGSVVSGEGSDSSVVVLGSVPGKETEIALSGTAELSVGHLW